MIIDRREDGALVSEATVKVQAGGSRVISTEEGNGRSTRSTARCARRSSEAYPRLADFELTDYKVRILPGKPAPMRSPGCWSRPPTGNGSGPPSACTATSSRRPGWRWHDAVRYGLLQDR